MRSLVKSAIQILVAVAILTYLVWSNWSRLADELRDRPIGWGYLAAGFGVSLAATLLTFLRWYLLVWAQDLPLRLQECMRISFISFLFNLVIPGAVGGDLVKVVLLAREQERRVVAIATVMIDRIVGLFGLILLTGLVVACSWPVLKESEELRRVGQFALGLTLVATVGMSAMFSRTLYATGLFSWGARLPVVGGAVGEMVSTMAVYRSKWRVVLLTILMSMVGHVGFVGSLRMGMAALSDELPTARIHFILAPLALMVGAVPLTPGGAGPVELVMKWLFDLGGENGALAMLTTLVFRGVQVMVAMVGLVYYLATRSETRRALATEPPKAE